MATFIWGLYIFTQAAIASYLLQPFMLLALYGIAKAWGSGPRRPAPFPEKQFRFGIFVTAHTESEFIPPIIDSILKQTYPFFNVYVIADACNVSNLYYTDHRVHLLSPPLALNSKIASLEYGLQHLQETDEVLVIMDHDNLLHPRFLEVLNTWYRMGFLAVQGNLKPKNQEGAIARLDASGATFANFVDRASRSILGLSANICGCGISIHRAIYEKIIYDKKSSTGGFDKHLQIELALRVPRIGFAADSITYDEKVDDPANFEQQRTRWIAAYFKFLGKTLPVLRAGWKKIDLNLMYFGYNLLRPPYFLLVLAGLLLCGIDFLIAPPLFGWWLIVFGIFLVSFVLILYLDTPDRTSLKTVAFLPLLIFHQLRSLLRSGAAKKRFLGTRHSKIVYIEELLEKSHPHR
jgi:cellulose synthase/poly-beta-1,6-N-acetylglucosamine synthase-like glycosyltransferase